MKRLFLVVAVMMISYFSMPAKAQLNVNVNIGSQPLWGPTGYDHVDYYYLPDVESYYYVPKKQFVYLNGNDWVFANSLPPRYGNYDLYNGYKVVINSPKPYLNFNNDKIKYAKYKGNKGQLVIRDSRDSKYYIVKGHPHGMPPGQAKKIYGKGSKGNGNNGKGHGNGKGKH
ncbi:hypothetical protein [Pedobacter paludis]|uniref:Uncharacterized protein n=1 Tax=Pedobacter paludis TaxID=2203212 RepID=A0A317F4P9_9SPHI|nr:hypothetical protein [Pedobacter paludis]PWS33542.1 hypothetical protein DF947_02670 [Pedobacter paludis]